MECKQCGHKIPQGKDKCIYCGRPVDGAQGDPGRDPSEGADASIRETRLEEAEAYLSRQTDLMRSRRKSPVSKVLLAILFFLSMLVGGLIVWWFA